jgi:hypothetical protein
VARQPEVFVRALQITITVGAPDPAREGRERGPNELHQDGPAPSLHPRYRGFVTTMSRSECRPRDGTQRLADSACLCALPLATPTGGSIEASPPTFHVKAADRTRVAYMPGTHKMRQVGIGKASASSA